MNVIERTCPDCSTTHMSRRSRCRLCYNEYKKGYYLRNKTRIDAKQKEYRDAGKRIRYPEKELQYSKTYRAYNKELLRVNQRAYVARNHEKVKAKNRIYKSKTRYGDYWIVHRTLLQLERTIYNGKK